MNKFLATLVSIVITAAFVTPSLAGTKDPRVNHRQHRQDARIAQGVKLGELTRAERKDLVADRRDIRREERQFKSDGTLTKDERQELHQDQAAANKEIYQEKHDDQARQ
ncbi:MAG: hypothetical protein ACXW1P_05805 [Methylophilaceae bacterium]